MSFDFWYVVSVVDGDTVKCNFQGAHPIFASEIPVRVRGVNCPGLRDKNPAQARLAIGAKSFVTRYFAEASVITCSNITRDKYFRFDADFTLDGRDLVDWIVADGIGEPYEVEVNNIEDPTEPPLNDDFTFYEPQLNPNVIHRVIDGDTFICDLYGQPEICGARIPVRLNYCDAYELNDPVEWKREKAELGRDRLEEILGNATNIDFFMPWRDKYFRVRADVFADGSRIRDILVAEGLAIDQSQLP